MFCSLDKMEEIEETENDPRVFLASKLFDMLNLSL